MKKVARLVGICSRPLQERFLAANAEQREKLREVITQESEWMIRKMEKKGYQLEATISEVFGVFTRGAARGTVELLAPGSSVPRP